MDAAANDDAMTHCHLCDAWAACTGVEGWSMSLGETVDVDICRACLGEDGE